MKQQLLTLATVLALTGVYTAQTAFAEESKPTESHEAHHPDQQKEAETNKDDQGGMMGKMDMHEMMGMMKQSAQIQQQIVDMLAVTASSRGGTVNLFA